MSRQSVFYCRCGARLQGSSARLFHRCAPNNAQQEPPYPNHETVVMPLSAPNMTAHLATQRCAIEYPHTTEECGEFIGRAAPRAGGGPSPQEPGTDG